MLIRCDQVYEAMSRRNAAVFFALIFVMTGLLLSVVLPLHAQSTDRIRDYALIDVRSRLADNDRRIVLEITVENQGSDATGNTTLAVEGLNEGLLLVEEPFSPLAAGERRLVQISLPVTDFEPGSVQALRVRVGIDNFELNNTPLAQNNSRDISVTIPMYEAVSENPPLFEVGEDGSVIILGRTFTQSEIVAGVLGFLAVVIVLWLLSVILRLLFRRAPRMEPWQPPYGHIPPLDAYSPAGRRHAWQGAAQNGAFLTAPQEGKYHAIKLLLGRDGQPLAGWHVAGLQLSQYDAYGRLARTNTVAERKWTKRLDRIARRQAKWSTNKLEKRLRPVARALVAAFKRQIGGRANYLSIAFDVRFSGRLDDVRIVFELYQFRQGAWYPVDAWEPELQLIGQQLQENYTYTIHGRQPTENNRQFWRRLQDDLVWLLVDTLRNPVMIQRQSEAQRQQPSRAPETLSNLPPVGEIGGQTEPTSLEAS